jgi:phosphoribosylformylglycinamidine synthase
MRFDVRVEVRLRPGVADPQGQTIERSLPTLGYHGVTSVRVGKSIRFTLEAASREAAELEAADMCARFLTNPVIEDSEIVLSEPSVAR